MINNGKVLFSGWENYRGGINNLAWCSSYGIVTASTRSMDAAMKNHAKKLKRLRIEETA